MKNFKFTLTELYAITDEMIMELLSGGLTKTEEKFLLNDLVETTEELVMNNCKRFIWGNGADELAVEDLYVIATGICLPKAIEVFTFDKGIHFLTFWKRIMDRYFINEFKRCSSGTEKFHQLKVCSSDAEIGEGGKTILSTKPDDRDMGEEVTSLTALLELIENFDVNCSSKKGNRSVYGKIIKALSLENKELQRAGIRKILGEEVSEANFRKIVSRARQEFNVYLKENDYFI